MAAADSGRLDTTTLPSTLSTQRNAGMSTTEPCRMPHWLTPVCDDQPVSHADEAVARRRAASGAGSARRPTAAPGRAPTWPGRRSGRTRSRDVGGRRPPGPAPGPAGQVLVEPGVVVEGQHRRHERRHRTPDPITMATPVQKPVEGDAGEAIEHEHHHQRIEHDRPEPQRQHRDRDHDDRQRRPDERVDQTDDEAGQQRVDRTIDREAAEQPRQHPQRQPRRRR